MHQQQQHTDDAPECWAECSINISHNTVTLTATLHMGGFPQVVTRTWRRHKGTGRGWVSRDRDFIADESRIGVELAEFMDALSFPYAVANMLPGKRASADVVAEAAKAVANG